MGHFCDRSIIVLIKCLSMSDFLVALSPNARILYKLVLISVNFCFNAQSGNQNGFNEQFYSCLLLSKKGISFPSLKLFGI